MIIVIHASLFTHYSPRYSPRYLLQRDYLLQRRYLPRPRLASASETEAARFNSSIYHARRRAQRPVTNSIGLRGADELLLVNFCTMC